MKVDNGTRYIYNDKYHAMIDTWSIKSFTTKEYTPKEGWYSITYSFKDGSNDEWHFDSKEDAHEWANKTANAALDTGEPAVYDSERHRFISLESLSSFKVFREYGGGIIYSFKDGDTDSWFCDSIEEAEQFADEMFSAMEGEEPEAKG